MIYNTEVTTLHCEHMQSITLNILILFKKLFYIINNRYGEIIYAKYDGSMMNDVCTVCPADIVCPPYKSHTADHILFEKESNFCTAFVSATGWPTWESAHEMCFKLQHVE